MGPTTPFRTAPLRRPPSPDRKARLEVIARWGDELLAVAHLRPGERFVFAARVDGHRRGTHALVHPAVGAGIRLVAEHTPDGSRRVWRQDGGAPEEVTEGDAAAWLEGEVLVLARVVWCEAGVAPRELVDRGAWVVLALALGLLLLAATAAASRRLLPSVERWVGEPCGCAARHARDLRALVARWPARSDHAAPEVAPTAPRPVRRGCGARYCIRGNPPPQLTRQQARELVQNRGFFAALGGIAYGTAGPDVEGLRVSCHWLSEGRYAFDLSDVELTIRVWTMSQRAMRGGWLTLEGRFNDDGTVEAIRQTAGPRSYQRLLRAFERLRLGKPSRWREFRCYLNA